MQSKNKFILKYSNDLIKLCSINLFNHCCDPIFSPPHDHIVETKTCCKQVLFEGSQIKISPLQPKPNTKKELTKDAANQLRFYYCNNQCFEQNVNVFFSINELLNCVQLSKTSFIRTFSPVLKCHLNTRPFGNRTGFEHLNTGLVQYSDAHCITIKFVKDGF